LRAPLHWGSHTSSATWVNTTSTSSPISTSCGSIEFNGAPASATTLPTKRIDGSSSSSTTTTLYGAWSPYAGSSGGWGMTTDHTRARPDISSHVVSNELQYGHIGRGGMRRRPHDAQAWTRSSPSAHPAQNG